MIFSRNNAPPRLDQCESRVEFICSIDGGSSCPTSSGLRNGMPDPPGLVLTRGHTFDTESLFNAPSEFQDRMAYGGSSPETDAHPIVDERSRSSPGGRFLLLIGHVVLGQSLGSIGFGAVRTIPTDGVLKP